jgi:hypothetical protein
LSNASTSPLKAGASMNPGKHSRRMTAKEIASVAPGPPMS